MSDATTTDQRHQAILETLMAIPAGCVSTYGRIAEQAGYPGHARYVGYILKRLPDDSRIPWHRVVNASGRSSFPPGSSKQQKQLQLLLNENVRIVNSKISLADYLWPTQS